MTTLEYADAISKLEAEKSAVNVLKNEIQALKSYHSIEIQQAETTTESVQMVRAELSQTIAQANASKLLAMQEKALLSGKLEAAQKEINSKAEEALNLRLEHANQSQRISELEQKLQSMHAVSEELGMAKKQLSDIEKKCRDRDACEKLN